MSWLPEGLGLIQLDERFEDGRVQPYFRTWRGPILPLTDERLMDVALHNIDITTAAKAREMLGTRPDHNA